MFSILKVFLIGSLLEPYNDIKFKYLRYVVQVISDKKFWEELIVYVPLIRHERHRERKNYEGYTDTQRTSCSHEPTELRGIHRHAENKLLS
jgi:hypothetical protein